MQHALVDQNILSKYKLTNSWKASAKLLSTARNTSSETAASVAVLSPVVTRLASDSSLIHATTILYIVKVVADVCVIAKLTCLRKGTNPKNNQTQEQSTTHGWSSSHHRTGTEN